MRIVTRLLLPLIVIIAAAWAGLWYYAQARMAQGIADWAAQTAASGGGKIKVTYDSMTRGDSPLHAAVTVTNLRLIVDNQLATPVTVTLPAVTSRIDVANPMVLHIDLPPQINITTSKGDAAVSFGSTDLQEQLNQDVLFKPDATPFSSGSLDAHDVKITTGGGSLLIAQMDELTSQNQAAVPVDGGKFKDSGAMTITNFAISPIFAQFAKVPFGGKVKTLEWSISAVSTTPHYWTEAVKGINVIPADDTAGRQKAFAKAAHVWASQGGTAETALTLAIGPSTLTGAANVAFDANLQPQGTGAVHVDHLDAFTQAILESYPDAQSVINSAQAVLSPYLSTTPDGGQVLDMKFAVAKQALTINGTKVQDVPPLNWDTLENPAPAVNNDVQQAPSPDSGGTPPAPDAGTTAPSTKQ